jgi:hypothetical protein
MKKQSVLAVGAAVLLVCGSALAGTATFSGTTGDTAVLLPNVAYDPCSFYLAPGASSDVASLLGVFPLISDVPGTVSLELVANETAGGELSLEITLLNNVSIPNGSIAVRLSSDQLSLVRSKGGTTTTLGTAAVVSGITSLQLEITATNAILSYDDGNGLVEAANADLSNLGGTEDVTGDRVIGLNLRAANGGPTWHVNRLVWTGNSVPDTNSAGCQLVTVPDVVGLTQFQAIATLQAVGFFAVTVEFDGDLASPTPGAVVSQDPAGNTLVPIGPVTIVLGGVASQNDTDLDGLDDDWETQNFGDLSQGRWGDPDGDKSWNIREFQNQTDPNNPESLVPVADYRGLIMLALILGAVGVLAAVRMGRAA